MLALSQTTGYAILALGCLEVEGGRWVITRQIAACTGIPISYLSKILSGLTRSGLVEAKRGYHGGFRLKRPASEISIAAVSEVVEGGGWLPACLLRLPSCSPEEGCPASGFWSAERERIEKALREITLREVAAFAKSRDGTFRPCRCSGACGEEKARVGDRFAREPGREAGRSKTFTHYREEME